MTANVIDGKKAAATVLDSVKSAGASLSRDHGIRPGIAVVIVGDDPASHAYVSSKAKMAKECGFLSIQHSLNKETTQADLASLIAALNDDPTVHGILVQLPLPSHLHADPIIQSIKPEKDVDGLHHVNAGKIVTGDVNGGLVSCTPAGAIIFVRKIHGPNLSGLNALVIGRSNLFGKPMSALLLAAGATVTTAHKTTKDVPGLCRAADIVVVAVGQPEMVKSDWIRPGATVIDVGINRVSAPEKGEGKTKLVGDVDFSGVEKVAGTITPVPGGVGPMTIAMLMMNTVIAAYRSGGVPLPDSLANLGQSVG